MKIRVYYEDTDIGGVVYYANYLKFIERARSELFFAKGISPFGEDGHFVVARVEADFLRSARLGDLLEVKTVLLQAKAASILLLQSIYLGEQKIFEAKVKLAFILNSKPAKIPRQILQILL